MAYNDYNLLMNKWNNNSKGGTWGKDFNFSIVIPYTRYRKIATQYTYYWENIKMPAFPSDIEGPDIDMTNCIISFTPDITSNSPTWTDVTSTIKPTIVQIRNIWKFDYSYATTVSLVKPALKIAINWTFYNYGSCYDTLKIYQKFFIKGSNEIFKIKSDRKTNEVHGFSVTCDIQRDENYDGTFGYCYIYNGNPYPVKCSIQNYEYYDSEGGPRTGGLKIWEQIIQPDSRITFAYFSADYMIESVNFDLYITAPGMTPFTRHYSKVW